MRDPEKTRSKILESAYEVIYRQGFRATSVNDVVRGAGVTQGAFFHYFPTKNELGYSIVDEMLMEMMLNRWTRPLAAYKNPVHGIIARYRKNMEELDDEAISLGCPLNNLTQEMSPVDQVFKEKLQTVLKAWISETERYLKKAQAEGYLKPDVDAKKVAEFVVMAEEGSAGIMKSVMDRKVYNALYESFRYYLESLGTEKVHSPY